MKDILYEFKNRNKKKNIYSIENVVHSFTLYIR